MSQLAYGSLNVHLLRTVEFRVEAEYDPSGVDQLWNKYTIRVRGTITDDSSLPTGGAAKLAAIKYHLEQPRQNLTYTATGGTVLLSVTAPDARYGPEPMPAVVHQMTEGVIFVEWGVVARVASCPDRVLSTGGGQVPSGVVSLKWEQAESYDENWTTTLRTSGLLITRTDVTKSADSYRGICTPPVANNFVRQNAEYVLNEAGTRLRFSFSDKEKFVGPPQPATRASGQFSISNVAGGGKRIGQVVVRLEGPPGVSRYDLMIKAVQVAASKLESARPVTAKGQALYHASYTEHLYDNAVEVSLQAMLAPVNLSERAALNKQVFGNTPGGAANMPGVAPPVRRRIAQLFAAPFMDPCGQTGSPGTDTGGDTERTLVNETQNVQVRVAKTVDDPRALSTVADDDVAGYDFYETTASWEWEEGRVHLPATGVGTAPKKSKVVQASGGVMRLVLFWTCRRRGTPPVTPAYVSQDPNLVEMGGVQDPEGTDFNGDAVNPVYTVSGRYYYAVLDPTAASVFAPVLPFTERTLTADFARLPSKYVSKQMTGSATGSGGAMPFIDAAAGAGSSAIGGLTDAPGAGSGGVGTRTDDAATTPPDDAIPKERSSSDGLPLPPPAFNPPDPDVQYLPPDPDGGASASPYPPPGSPFPPVRP